MQVISATVVASPQSGDVGLRQIVVASELEARQVRAALTTGASFEVLASQQSRDITASRGGYLGRVGLQDLRTEVRRAIERLGPGDVSNPVRVDDAFVLFQIVPEADSRWIELDEAGAQALASGRNADAVTRYEKALDYAEKEALGDARLARSLDSLASVYSMAGRSAESEPLYRRALAVLQQMHAPELETAQVLTGLGKALTQQSRFEEAEPVFERALSIRKKSLGPNHPEVALTISIIADLLAGRGRFSEAAELFDRSLAMLEKSVDASHPAAVAAANSRHVFQRSLIPELLDRFSKIISLSEFRDDGFSKTMTEIREIFPLAPLSEYSFVQMKDILTPAGLLAETEEVLRVGLARFPVSRILRIDLAELLADTGRTQDALSLLEEAKRMPWSGNADALADGQQQAIIQQRIGDMQFALSNLEAALIAYRRSLELDPAAPAGRLKLGRAYIAASSLDLARLELEHATQQAPDDSEAYLSLSEVHLASGQWELSVAAAGKAIETGTHDPRALYLLGTALMRTGKREEGQQRLGEFERVEQDFQDQQARGRDIASFKSAAIAAMRGGDGNAAVRHLNQGLALYPDDTELRMSLASVDSRLGQHQQAVEILESILERKPSREFLIHRILADEYEILGNPEASRRHRKIYLGTREAELVAK